MENAANVNDFSRFALRHCIIRPETMLAATMLARPRSARRDARTARGLNVVLKKTVGSGCEATGAVSAARQSIR
ncbi:MAG TPA: hypothetical protein VFF96_09315 [Pseudoxanthomonas sp.]|nr:hypothetical protein [Pseudoxanthomonas sp.]